MGFFTFWRALPFECYKRGAHDSPVRVTLGAEGGKSTSVSTLLELVSLLNTSENTEVQTLVYYIASGSKLHRAVNEGSQSFHSASRRPLVGPSSCLKHLLAHSQFRIYYWYTMLNIVRRHQRGTLVHKNYNWCVALPKPNTVKTLLKFVDSFRANITWFMGQGQDETAHKPHHYSIKTQMCAFHLPGFLVRIFT